MTAHLAFMKIMSICYALPATQSAVNVMVQKHIAYRARVDFTIFSMDVMQAVRLGFIRKMVR